MCTDFKKWLILLKEGTIKHRWCMIWKLINSNTPISQYQHYEIYLCFLTGARASASIFGNDCPQIRFEVTWKEHVHTESSICSTIVCYLNNFKVFTTFRSKHRSAMCIFVGIRYNIFIQRHRLRSTQTSTETNILIFINSIRVRCFFFSLLKKNMCMLISWQ